MNEARTDNDDQRIPPVVEQARWVEQQVLGGARALDRAVRTHPWPAIAIAGLFGFLAGWLTRRR
jgi:ElaB/YqjD/DUF883 family membrane-anchored ribosome-binding protein